jgi:AraC-like DNA-binding protein
MMTQLLEANKHLSAQVPALIQQFIKALTGKSPSLFIRSIRLHHGKQMLLNTTRTVSEIAYEVGFSSLNYFSDAFFEEFGERPLKARGGGA